MAGLVWGESVDITSTFTINDKDVQDGDIVVSGPDGVSRASTTYAQHTFGVYQVTPLAVYRYNQGADNKPIIRNGTAQVNVTSVNGDIKLGDYITTSAIVGKGQKATQSGYVLGVALADFTGSDGTKASTNGQSYSQGQIPVAVKIEYAEINSSRTLARLLDSFNAVLFKNLQNPDRFVQILKYIIAGFILILALVVGYLSFARSSLKSIEAIGRNPLARSTILFSMGISIAVTILIALIGVGAALIIVRL